jgi:heme/copper-type cytochrome/quinol oxidase subunit 2
VLRQALGGVRTGLAAVVLGAAAVAVPVLSGCGPSGDASGGAGADGFAYGDTLLVRMTGGNYTWQVRYAGADGKFGTADDRHATRHLHVPARTPVTLELRSEDYIYTMALPHLDLKEIAVPDLEFALRFELDEPGEYRLEGDQMCGYTHPDLMGTVVAEDGAAFREWVTSLPAGPGRDR